MTIRYDARALKDIEAIHRYIAQDDPIAAVRVVSRIEHAVERLAVFPLSARPGRVPGTRVLAVPTYVMIHRVRGDFGRHYCSTPHGAASAELADRLCIGI
jgi:toxin ParE1/3/4